MKRKFLGSTLLGCASSFLVLGAVAQESSGGSTATRAPTNFLEEVVVTARKREETAQDIPVAVSAFSEDFIKANAVTDIEGISMFTPGLVTGKGTGETGGNLFMRGIGSGQHSALLEQSVSVNVDGAQAGGQLMFASMLDLERIEVLKGPQALFYGKNSPGGVISIVTAGPTDYFEASIKGGYEFDAKQRYGQAVISGPLFDRVKGRLMAYYSEQDGYLDIKSVDGGPMNAVAFSNKEGPKRDETVLRGSLVFDVNDRLSIDTRVTYSGVESEEGFAMFSQITACPTGQRQAFHPIYAAIEDCKPNDTIVTGNIADWALDASPSWLRSPTGFTDNEIYLATVNVTYDLTDELSLTSLTSYYGVKLDQASNYTLQPASVLNSSTGLDSDRFSQEFRLFSSYAGPVNFAAGAYFEKEEAMAYTNVNVGGGLLGTEITDQDKDAYSIFAQVIWDVTDKLTLEAGARYSDEKKESAFESTMFAGVPGSKPKYEADNISPEVTLTYFVNDDVMIYGSYREGFKSGGIDTAFGAPTRWLAANDPSVIYDEETVEGFEGGLKATWLDGTLQTNFAIFDYTYDDMQLSILDTQTLSVNVFNAAKSKTRGMEFDFLWSVPRVEGLTLQGAIAYLDAKFKDYEGTCYNGQSIANGCNLALLDKLDDNGNVIGQYYSRQDRSGERMTLAPKWTGSLGFIYERPIVGGWWMSLAGTLEYSDEYQADAEGSPWGMQDSYTRTHASLRLFSDDGLWEFALIGRNLGNEYVVSRASPDTMEGTLYGTDTEHLVDMFGTVSRGREVFLEVTRNF